jgi:antitoxin (DNA-binding transcriptional repressor) of toxin-antitoxin stability system
MKATLLDLRRRPGIILEAIARNETVTLSKRGRQVARIVPNQAPVCAGSIKDSPAFGIWKDRADMKDPAAFVRTIRKGRFRDL